MVQQVNSTAVSVDSLAAAMVNKLFTATMGIDQAVLGVAESLTRLDESFKENGKNIDIHSAKGQANRESVLASVTANMQLYQAQISAGMSAEDAAAAYDQNTAALEAQLKKAHLTQGEIDGLIGKYRGIPSKVDTDIAMHGLTDAINGLNETIRLINGLHDKTVYVTVKQVGDNPRGQSRGGGFAYGGIRRAASGMIVGPSSPGTLIGEPQTGGEALIPLQGISASRARALAQTAVGGYGLAVVPQHSGGQAVAVSFAFTGGSTDWLAQGFMHALSDGKVQAYVNGARVQARP
jgi:ribosome-associated translation inhibitor RaiA